MIKNAKDLRNKSLPDVLEKRLIIARYFINQKNAGKEFKEQDVYYMWNNYFPSDFRISQNRKLKLQEGKHFGQLVLLEHSANIDKALIKNYSNKWGNIYCWIMKYIRSHTLEDCDTDIQKLRKNNYRELIKVFKPLRYYVRDTTEKASSHRLATYNIFHGKEQRSGCYSCLMDYANEQKESKK